MNDIIRILFGDFKDKHNVEYIFAALTASSGYVYQPIAILSDPNNNLFLGSGLGIGSYWSDISQKGRKINII